MKKTFLIFILLPFFACSQNMEFLGPVSLTDETADGKQVFVVLGDSKSQGTSDGVGPTVSAGVMYQWNRSSSSVTSVTSGDVLYINSTGSEWPRFGINYNALTGKKVVLVNNGAYFSTAYWNNTQGATGNSWDINGKLYRTMVNRTNSCLASLGLTKVKGFIIILGTNDVALGVSSANFGAAYNSLITRINSDFNNPPIYIVSHARSTSYDLAYTTYLQQAEQTWSNVYWCVSESAVYRNGYTFDGVHYNAAGNDYIGRMLSDYIADTETDKDVRRVTNGMCLTQFNSTQKALIKTFVQNQKTAGNWSKLVSLQIYKTSNTVNKFWDLVSHGSSPSNNSADVSNNGYISTTGTQWVDTGLSIGNYVAPSTASDVISGIGIATQSTPVATQGCAFGTSSGTFFSLRQMTNSTIQYTPMSGSVSGYSGATGFVSNTDYAIYRSGASACGFIINGTTVSTASTSVGTPTNSVTIAVGKLNGNPEYNSAQYKYFFYAQNTGFSYSSFISDLNTLMASL